MKKRLLIICSIIGVLLAGFQFPIYAEETTPDYSSSTSIITSAALDQYFYDNYELLPYIESNGNQYINTNYKPNNNSIVNIKFGGFEQKTGYLALFGSEETGKKYFILTSLVNKRLYFDFNISEYVRSFNVDDFYNIYSIQFGSDTFINNEFVGSFEGSFNSSYDLFIFALNKNGNPINYSSYKLYGFSIYDSSLNDGEGALVHDYYPARSKSGGVIGLYDAVTKTFVTTSGSVPFASPTGDPTNLSLGANITQFLSGSLSWIGAIFEGINEMPIIWVFIAIALAGVMFRWARRIVHF